MSRFVGGKGILETPLARIACQAMVIRWMLPHDGKNPVEGA